MPLKKEQLKREFIIDNKGTKTTLADPDPNMTPEQVMTFYSNTYPELVTSTVQGPEYRGDVMTFSFKTTVGTKG